MCLFVPLSPLHKCVFTFKEWSTSLWWAWTQYRGSASWHGSQACWKQTRSPAPPCGWRGSGSAWAPAVGRVYSATRRGTAWTTNQSACSSTSSNLQHTQASVRLTLFSGAVIIRTLFVYVCVGTWCCRICIKEISLHWDFHRILCATVSVNARVQLCTSAGLMKKNHTFILLQYLWGPSNAVMQLFNTMPTNKYNSFLKRKTFGSFRF